MVISFSVLTKLKDTGYHLERNMFTISLPECCVLSATLLIVTECAVSEQEEEKYHVGVGHEVFKSSRNSPEESQE